MDEMNDPRPILTLVGLQRRLDELGVGQRLTVAIGDYRRLFGENSVAQGRLENFARGHGCRFDAGPSSITFEKTANIKL